MTFDCQLSANASKNNTFVYMKRDDTLWKGILENIFDDFLRFFFKEAEAIFDFGKGFEFLDKELEQLFPVEDGEAPKFVDKLVKVFTKVGKEEWILIHIEVQGYDDKDFSKRMFTYFYRILDKYGKPTTAIAIFSDDNKKFHPKEYVYEYLGTENIFRFNTYKIIEQDETVLAKNGNPFAVVVLTVLLALKKKKLSDENLYDLKYSLAKSLLQQNIPLEKVRYILVFLHLYVRFANPVFNIKFDKAIDVLTEKNKTMGIIEQVLERAKKEGKAEGKAEVKAEVVKNLLSANKFTIAEIANFASVSEAFVKDVQKSQS